MGHALGVWHEQSRYDRDSYIKVNTGFLNDASQYELMTTTNTNNYNVAYDYGSVMHYPAGIKIPIDFLLIFY